MATAVDTENAAIAILKAQGHLYSKHTGMVSTKAYKRGGQWLKDRLGAENRLIVEQRMAENNPPAVEAEEYNADKEEDPAVNRGGVILRSPGAGRKFQRRKVQRLEAVDKQFAEYLAKKEKGADERVKDTGASAEEPLDVRVVETMAWSKNARAYAIGMIPVHVP